MEPIRPKPPTPPAGPNLTDHDETSELNPQPTMPPLNLPPDIHSHVCNAVQSVFSVTNLPDELKEEYQKKLVDAINAKVDLPVLNERQEAWLIDTGIDLLEPVIEGLRDDLFEKLMDAIGCPKPV